MSTIRNTPEQTAEVKRRSRVSLLTVMECKQLALAAEYLRLCSTPNYLRGFNPGICDLLSTYRSFRKLDYLPAGPTIVGWYAPHWPLYSGYAWFPVPHPSMPANLAFHASIPKWDGEYGDNRRKFCLFIAEQTELDLKEKAAQPEAENERVRKPE